MASQSASRLRFGRHSRIKQGRDFARMKEQGQRLVHGCLALNWRLRGVPLAASRVGVITSSRIGSAVVRNRARRLLRESFRLHQHELAQPVDLVLVARSSIVGKAFCAVERDFLASLRKARLLRHTGQAAGGLPADRGLPEPSPRTEDIGSGSSQTNG